MGSTRHELVAAGLLGVGNPASDRVEAPVGEHEASLSIWYRVSVFTGGAELCALAQFNRLGRGASKRQLGIGHGVDHEVAEDLLPPVGARC